MHDTAPQTADGKVLWHFTMSLDGFVAGPGQHPRGGSQLAALPRPTPGGRGC